VSVRLLQTPRYDAGSGSFTAHYVAHALTHSHAVLLDINMPRKDGFEACAEMREIEKNDPNRPRAQIIAVTALSADEEKRHGHE
jgi:CheY-like chemotaxis protein